MTDVGELFVRIRLAPGSAAAFEAEATPGVASAGKGLAKTFLAAFAIGGVAKTIETVVKAATGQQSAFAVLNQTISNAGAQNQLYGKSIDDLLEKESTLKGFSTGDLAQSFTVLVSATKNSGEAFKDLGLAEDIARARHVALATAALGVAKAEQGSATALQRSGIIVPQVTAAVDALKTAHENAVIAGAKFTDQQKAEYAAALVTAAAQDKAATRLKDLATIQQRFGGDSATFAQTATGQFDRLDSQLHEVEVSIGNNIIPVLLTGTEDAIEFAKALASPEVLAVIGTYATLRVGLAGVSAAQSLYQKAIDASKASTVAETVAIQAEGAAAETAGVQVDGLATQLETIGPAAETGIAQVQLELAGLDAALTETQLSIDGLGAAFEELPIAAGVAVTETETELAPLAGATAGLDFGAFGAGLIALVNPVTAGVLGIAALAGGIAYLATREGVTTQATHDLEGALRDLGSAQQAVPTDRLSISQDKLNVAHDNAAIKTSQLSHSSLDYQQLLLNLSRDTLQLESDQKSLGLTLQTVADDFDKARAKAIGLADAEQAGTKPRRVGEFDFGSSVSQQTQLQQRATESYVKGIQQVIATSSGLTTVQEHNLVLLEQYAEVIGKIPTKAQTTLILDNKSATLTLENFLNEIQGLPQQTATESKAAGTAIVDNLNAGVLASAAHFGLKGLVEQSIGDLGSLVPDAEAQGENVGNAFFAGVENALHSVDPILNAVKAQVAANAQLAQTTNPLKQQVADDQASLANLQQQYTDAATQGATDLANAIQSAKQNLDTIGQDIADSLATYIDKPLTDAATRISDAQAKLSLLNDKVSLSRLGEEVILPGNRKLSTDPEKAVAQLEALQKQKPNDLALQQYILQFRSLALQVEGDSNQIQQNTANLVTTAAKTRLANLTDLFNTGKISEGTLQRDITAVLEKNGLNAKTARSRGASFADTLAAQLAGVGQQADALKGFGNGSGLIPSITKPIDTLNATQKTLAGIASSERAKQLSESKTQTTLLKDINAAQKADAFTSSLDHNPGYKTQRSKRLTGVAG